MIELTAEMRAAAARRMGVDELDLWTEAALVDVLTIGERETRARIAYRIRAELVCCDVYERDHDTERAGRTHGICFWGEASARIAEDHGDAP